MFKLGNDIIEVERIKKAIERNESLKNNLFSNKEIEYCEKKKNKYESYSARFAAKEAYLKALGIGISSNKLNNIEILNDNNGKPIMYVDGEKIKGEVSISHSSKYAIATVIIIL